MGQPEVGTTPKTKIQHVLWDLKIFETSLEKKKYTSRPPISKLSEKLQHGLSWIGQNYGLCRVIKQDIQKYCLYQ